MDALVWSSVIYTADSPHYWQSWLGHKVPTSLHLKSVLSLDFATVHLETWLVKILIYLLPVNLFMRHKYYILQNLPSAPFPPCMEDWGFSKYSPICPWRFTWCSGSASIGNLILGLPFFESDLNQTYCDSLQLIKGYLIWTMHSIRLCSLYVGPRYHHLQLHFILYLLI